MDSQPTERTQTSNRATRIGDRIVLFIARHWLAMANLALFMFIALPFVAPVLMRAGMPRAARVFYTDLLSNLPPTSRPILFSLR